jgi:outer membrane protein OmpA-like peptidoglycan-associated protein
MQFSRQIVPLFALALCAQPAIAQSSATTTRGATGVAAGAAAQPGVPGAGMGTVEFGLFVQPSYLGASSDFTFGTETVGLDSRSVVGFGARLGFFVTPVWSVELDAMSASPDAVGGRSVDFRSVSVRGNYNFTVPDFGPRTSMLVGAGVTHAQYRGGDPRRTTSDWGIGGIAGLRFAIAGPVIARGDIVADYVPQALNIGARLGVGVVFGGNGFGTGGRTTATQQPVQPVMPTPPAIPDPPPTIGDEEDRAAALAGVDTIPLSRSIFFDYDQVNIRADAIPILETKLRWLNANPRLVLRIEGHADDRGQDEYNLSLSQRRAAETQAWFMSRGVATERLPIVGYGEEFPLCLQEPMTDACHQMNRRADFRIMRVGAQRLIAPR